MSSPADESDLQFRLQQRRREIDEEIEAFKAFREEEFRAFHEQLCEEYKHKKRKRDSHANGATWPVVGETELADTLKVDVQIQQEKPSSPYDKDIQDVFTPRYFPLLGKNRQSPPVPRPPPPAAVTVVAGPPQSTLPKPATPENSPAPIASSLKSSSGSSFGMGTTGKSPAVKQKSPKRVTFRFEDENSVPSRSSPPPAKVRWSLVADLGSEGSLGNDDDVQGVLEVGEEEFGGALDDKVEQAEGIAPIKEEAPVVPPTAPVKDGESFEEVPFGGGTSINGGATEPSAGVADDGDDGDDDDGDLFDMDETLPEQNALSPHRDYAALHNTFKPPSQRSPFSGHTFPPLPSFTPTPTASIHTGDPSPLLTFGKSGTPHGGLTAARGGISSSLVSSLILTPLPPQHTTPTAVASSLPNMTFAPSPRFRRRSIAKYSIPSPEDESSPTPPRQPPLSDYAQYSQSPNALSLPMPIHQSPSAPPAKSTTKDKVVSPSQSKALFSQPSPYSTALAAEVAAAAGEGLESIIGGVDGGTGLDGSCVQDRMGGGTGSLEDVAFERMSFAMRMAFEGLSGGG